MGFRKGKTRRSGNAGALSGRRFAIGHHLYRRSHGFARVVISTCIVSPNQLPTRSCGFYAAPILHVLRRPFRSIPRVFVANFPFLTCSCYVRARRLNVIIQPHLRFAYELLKWEEAQQIKRGKPIRRELEWATIAREIAAMNKPYTR